MKSDLEKVVEILEEQKVINELFLRRILLSLKDIQILLECVSTLQSLHTSKSSCKAQE